MMRRYPTRRFRRNPIPAVVSLNLLPLVALLLLLSSCADLRLHAVVAAASTASSSKVIAGGAAPEAGFSAPPGATVVPAAGARTRPLSSREKYRPPRRSLNNDAATNFSGVGSSPPVDLQSPSGENSDASATRSVLPVRQPQNANAVGGDSAPTRRSVLSTSTVLTCSSFLAGVADVLCHRRYGCYATMMTGNIIGAASAVSEGRFRDATRFGSLVGCYGAGSAVWRVLDGLLSESSYVPMAAEAAVATAAAVAVALPLLFVSDATSNVPLLALAFGIINACTVSSTGGTITFVQTGHVSTLGRYVGDCVLGVGATGRTQRTSKKKKKKKKKTTTTSTTTTKKRNGTSVAASASSSASAALKSARVLCGFVSGVATAALMSTWPGGTTGALSERMRRHPFAALGLAYSILLLLGRIKVVAVRNSSSSSEAAAANDLARRRSLAEVEKVMSSQLVDLYVKRPSLSSSSKAAARDIRMDGWTKMPSGPNQFDDGSER